MQDVDNNGFTYRRALLVLFFFQAEDGIRDLTVTGVQTCALPICNLRLPRTTTGAARALLQARAHAIDLGVVQRSDGAHYFAVVAGTGFDAQLMAGDRKSVV